MRPILPAQILLPLLLATPASGMELAPFTTDGCSAFPDGTLEQQSLWVECCIRHDLAYWKGGTYTQRLAADDALQVCVADVGEPEIAAVMLAGVRVGGSPFYPTTYRWGYGWPWPRGYRALTTDERSEVQRRLEHLKLMFESLATELD